MNTNLSSLIAQRVLRRNNDPLNSSRPRLGGGLKINRGKDTSARLIAGESLGARKGRIIAAIDNAEGACSVVGTAGAVDGTLNSLHVAFENASAAESALCDPDLVDGIATLTRSQILAHAGLTTLAQR